MKGVQTAFCLLPSSYIELTISRKHPWQYFSIILLSLILYSQRLKLENKNTTSCLTCNENENSCSHSSCVKTHTTNLWELHFFFLLSQFLYLSKLLQHPDIHKIPHAQWCGNITMSYIDLYSICTFILTCQFSIRVTC